MKLWVKLALLTCFLLFTGVAKAQMSEGERKAAARAAYTEGVDLQDKGRPAEALARFEAAQKLFDAPTHLVRIAQCQALTGKLVEASETYETLIRKQLPPGSPEPFVHAQEQGKAELAKLRPRIPTMRVIVKPDPQTLQNLQITMNDRVMPAELVGIARPVNPGSYRLSATANGWTTPAPTTIEVPESEQKEVVLTLQQGAPAATAPSVVTPAVAPPPPPYEQQQQATTSKPATGPSSSGLLVGVRGGVFVPSGDVDKATPFDKYASAGGGFGGDVIGRFAKLFLIGGTLEFASLGGPDASAFDVGVRAEVATRSVYYGILAGIMPNVDKVTFVADVGLGHRSISQTRTLSGGPFVRQRSEEDYGGVEVAINAGVSFPVGPIRIVPKAGFAFGQFTDRTCGAGASLTRGCAATSPTVNEAGHTIFNLALAVYYHVDLAKKQAATPAAASTQ